LGETFDHSRKDEDLIKKVKERLKLQGGKRKGWKHLLPLCGRKNFYDQD